MKGKLKYLLLPQMETEWSKEQGKTELVESLHYDSIRNDPYYDLLAMDIQRGRDQGKTGREEWAEGGTVMGGRGKGCRKEVWA